MMKRFPKIVAGIAILLVLGMIAVLPAQAGAVTYNKARFSRPLVIDNPYFPLSPGTTMIYEGTEERTSTYQEFVVTDQTQTILGIQTRVIRDRNWENGKLVEDTLDWYAQDDAGNVWYFGEFSTQYKNGKVTGHEGSWEAGVDGATAGIVMKARPKVGDTYQQEIAPGIAEDMATVISLNESICVPFGCFTKVLQTEEFSPLEPGIAEYKYYAPGIGQLKTFMFEGGEEVSELVDILK